MLKKIALCLLGITVTIPCAQAKITQQPLELGKPIIASVPITNPKHIKAGESSKKVVLMNIKLTPQQKQMILNYHPKVYSMNQSLPSAVYMGMNGVPVLDQGMHGTCTTFAVTAAIDAVLGKGDYISQLCSLELGSYLSEKSSYPPVWPPSGWQGSSGSIVLNQLYSFGFITKDTQLSKSCAGVTEYPLNDKMDEGKPMSLDESSVKNVKEFMPFVSLPILATYERFLPINPDSYDGNKVLMQVKETLALSQKNDLLHNYIVFGTFVPIKYCRAGICARYHAMNDTWALTKEMEHIDPMKDDELAGHEMVITGYDDNAIATDNNGVQHRGLLVLRNSWGDEVGDKGDYYMTYDFFEKFVMEAHRVFTFWD